MSYDFMMMKPRPERESEIESLEDLGEHTLLRQDPAALVEALSSLLPDIAWRREDGGGWFGSLAPRAACKPKPCAHGSHTDRHADTCH